jgi:hypothetical protein
MVRFFEILAMPDPDADKVAAKEGGVETPKPIDDKAAPREPGHRDRSWLGIAIASHPADAERIAFFRNAAAIR